MTVWHDRPPFRDGDLPGSRAKDWDWEELRSCGAVGTTHQAPFDLAGNIHPVFHSWVVPGAGGHDGEEVKACWLELRQPLLLASRILKTAGIQWLSEFCIDDIFGASYSGRQEQDEQIDQEFKDRESTIPETPAVIVRHHRASWATSKLARKWLASTAHELRTVLPQYIQWQLDPDMFRFENGPAAIEALDHPETIRTMDEVAYQGGATGCFMSVLVMKEYVSRLSVLRRSGRFGGEEYMFTAFMVAVTVLHELGHVIYWRDFRAFNRQMTEPYFGGDLEMELGDSFMASIFGGWVPVPVETPPHNFQHRGTFEGGLAWKQHLTWDLHKSRPQY
ncbi:hypothetical protein B0H66DRAFT_640535 [Apodospora peruviana]|uniref:Uncharacterized protein n=1 Tax=Apodospora peruviana TaxID=516989 RepID=A0AAE0I6D1_9PEZI|nr:hypothetical protein B0H66DRAFT_640535 [Apodospora peruviana]